MKKTMNVRRASLITLCLLIFVYATVRQLRSGFVLLPCAVGGAVVAIVVVMVWQGVVYSAPRRVLRRQRQNARLFAFIADNQFWTLAAPAVRAGRWFSTAGVLEVTAEGLRIWKGARYPREVGFLSYDAIQQASSVVTTMGMRHIFQVEVILTHALRSNSFVFTPLRDLRFWSLAAKRADVAKLASEIDGHTAEGRRERSRELS